MIQIIYSNKKKKKSKPLFEPITKKPEDFEPDIFIAAKQRKLSSIQYLIEKEGIDVNKKAEKDYGDRAIFKGDSPLHVACSKGHLPIVQYCIEKGAKIEENNDEQKTPLHIACSAGNLHIVQYLIGNGANIEVKTNAEWTPLHLASCHGKTEIVKYLLSKGANRNAK